MDETRNVARRRRTGAPGEPGGLGPEADPRDVYSITVDLLAVAGQIEPLLNLLGSAMCGEPDDHVGPCRVAWQMTVSGPGHDRAVPASEQVRIRGALAALEVWPPAQSTADLLAEAAIPARRSGLRDATGHGVLASGLGTPT